MDNVLDIVYEYSINHRLLDRKAISRILDIILKINEFDDRISYRITKDNKFDLTNIFDSNTLGEFDMNSMIYIYYQQMLKGIRKNKHLTKFDHYYELNNIDIMFKKNLFILETILHEIEHVKQLKTIKNLFEDSIEAKLYRYEYNYLSPCYDFFETGFVSFYIEIFKRELVYQRYYNISFLERMAKINSLEQIYKLLYQLGKDFSRLYGIQRYVINDFMMREYGDSLIGPTIRFMSNIGGMREFNLQGLPSVIDKMSTDERIRYGFNITDEEYKKRIKR